MRRALAAAVVAVLALGAAPARADETGERRFTVSIAARDAELRADCSRRLSAWWDELTAPDHPAPGWDETKWGPWSLVVRTSGGGFVEDGPGSVDVFVSVTAPELKSRADTADAYAAALLEGLRARVTQRMDARDRPERGRLEGDRARDESRARTLRTQISVIEDQHGGAPDRHEGALHDRIVAAERDLAQTGIDRAVTAKKLETARAAVERAVELARLQRDAGEVTIAVARTAEGDSDARRALESKLAQLRAQIDDLTRTTPPLDTAREQAFRLEVDLVGLEARGTGLAEELKALRQESAKARDDSRRHAPLVRELTSVESAIWLTGQQIAAHDAAAADRMPVFEVIRAPGPPSSTPAPTPPVKEEKR